MCVSAAFGTRLQLEMEINYNSNKYHKERINEKANDKFNSLYSHLPLWLKSLAELYMSPMKYKLKEEIQKENNFNDPATYVKDKYQWIQTS